MMSCVHRVQKAPSLPWQRTDSIWDKLMQINQTMNQKQNAFSCTCFYIMSQCFHSSVHASHFCRHRILETSRQEWCCYSLWGSEGKGQGRREHEYSAPTLLNPELLYICFKPRTFLHKPVGCSHAGLQVIVGAPCDAYYIRHLINYVFSGFLWLRPLGQWSKWQEHRGTALPPNKERKLTRPVSFNYRPTTFAKNKAKGG